MLIELLENVSIEKSGLLGIYLESYKKQVTANLLINNIETWTVNEFESYDLSLEWINSINDKYDLGLKKIALNLFLRKDVLNQVVGVMYKKCCGIYRFLIYINNKSYPIGKLSGNTDISKVKQYYKDIIANITETK